MKTCECSAEPKSLNKAGSQGNLKAVFHDGKTSGLKKKVFSNNKLAALFTVRTLKSR